jgi:multiple sugar transport system ATP-binding protein
MKDGFIQQVGTPEEVFEKPHNLFVAEFIGAPKMNVVRCELSLENGKYFVKPFGAKMEVDPEHCQMLKEKGIGSRQILLGVRPEHIDLAASAAENTINGKILVNEMMGSELHLHVAVDGNKMIARTPTVELSREERANLKNGHEVHLTFPGKVMYFFDPETELNLIY